MWLVVSVHSVHPPHPPFLLGVGGGGWGVEPLIKFSKRWGVSGGLDRNSSLRGGLLERRRVTFFRKGGGWGEGGGLQIFTKKIN